jgi:hypothetical protein
MLRIAAVALLAAFASASVASASCDLGMLSMYKLTSGHLAGTSWSLRAMDSGDGRYAFEVMIARSRRAHQSGHFYLKGQNGALVGLGWTLSSAGTRPRFVAGAVAQAAREVSIRLSNGSVRTVRTVPPTCGLSPGIAFFFAPIPARAHPISISARSAAGRVVVSWKR